jgi:hypothetical protein
MKRFAFACDSSAAGCMKQSRLFDDVTALDWQLVDWPAPTATGLPDFFERRWAIANCSDPLLANGEGISGALEELLRRADESDRLELWFGPELEDQLSLCLVIIQISARAELADRTVVVPLDVRLGAQRPEWIRAYSPTFLPLSDAMRDLAPAAWSAFCAPTPEPWLALMNQDTSALPYLGPQGRRWLQELPDSATGLSRTQRDWLEEIAANPQKMMIAFGQLGAFRAPTHGYWRLGEILVDMFNAKEPAITGVSVPVFDLALHEDSGRHRAFHDARPRLTPFGEALLAGEADYAAHNAIDRWWGGTHLTKGNLWRWSATTASLIAPA